jgi:PPOX class F420-dependent enzyme/OxyR family protein
MSAPSDPAAARTSRPAARFSTIELAYLLGEPHLGRLATTGETGQPHVVPVGWSYNSDLGTIDITGRNFAATRKYRNVLANPWAAFVIDDVLPPFRPRCVMVQGAAQALDVPQNRGTEAMIRIIPHKIISWGLEEGQAQEPS